jgi:hypothetical protein
MFMPMCQLQDHRPEQGDIRMANYERGNRSHDFVMLFATHENSDSPRAEVFDNGHEEANLIVPIFCLPAVELTYQFSSFAHVKMLDAWFLREGRFPREAEITQTP